MTYSKLSVKATRVLNSCKTPEHLATAIRYKHLAERALLDQPRWNTATSMSVMYHLGIITGAHAIVSERIEVSQ